MATTSRSAEKAATTRRRRPAPQPQAAVEQAPVKRNARKATVPTERPVEGYTVDLQDTGTETERAFEKLLAKEPNDNHRDFQSWFEEKTGEAVDLKTVQYVVATWAEFQRSPEHKAKTLARRQAAVEKRQATEAARIKRARELAVKAGLQVSEA
jgi:hypothetical protein